MTDGNGAIVHSRGPGGGLDGVARHLVGRFVFRPVVDDQREAARRGLGHVIETDLRAGPEVRAQLPKFAHDGSSSAVSGVVAQPPSLRKDSTRCDGNLRATTALS